MRVTVAEVSKLTGIDATSDVIPLAIETANAIVDEYLTTHTDAIQRQLELYLAAHFAKLASEQGPIASETLGDATERYHNIYEAGYKATRFGQQAILLDTTGTLSEMSAAAQKPMKKALFTVVGDVDMTTYE